MFNEIRLSGIFMLYLISAALIPVYFLWDVTDAPPLIQLMPGLSLIVGVESLVMGIMMTYYWVKDKQYYIKAREKRLKSITPESEFANSLQGLSEKQTDLVRYFLKAGVSDMKIESVEGFITTGSEVIPMSFVQDFLERSMQTHPYLIPIREYPNDSVDQRYAKAFTDYLVAHSIAVPASGNRPAKLLSWFKLLRLLGWT